MKDRFEKTSIPSTGEERSLIGKLRGRKSEPVKNCCGHDCQANYELINEVIIVWVRLVVHVE